MALPAYALIIGAMKAGTTSLYEMLIQHPQICACRVKEPHYFCKDRDYRYHELWGCEASHPIVRLEASTNYTKYPEVRKVPSRIREYGLTPKFIYVVRNPVDRIQSQYNFMKHDRGVRITSVYDNRLVTCSKYGLQLEQFVQEFPDRDQFLILNFDDLKSNPIGVSTKCFEFLGLAPHPVDNNIWSNQTAASTSDVWIRRSGRLKNTVGRRLSSNSRKLIKSVLRGVTPSISYSLSTTERRELVELLRPDMKLFSDRFGFDVSMWGF